MTTSKWAKNIELKKVLEMRSSQIQNERAIHGALKILFVVQKSCKNLNHAIWKTILVEDLWRK